MQINGFSSLSPELIVWEDISVCDNTWADDSDLDKWFDDASDALVEQVGYVLYEDDRVVIMAESFIEAMELYGNVTKIPKSVIRKRTKLNPVEQNEPITSDFGVGNQGGGLNLHSGTVNSVSNIQTFTQGDTSVSTKPPFG
jgi:hypothetical protein